jgi:hypothetical protein
MQSIRDIIDTKLSLGFSYFYGIQNGEGYLRRMLHTNPSLEAIYSQLRDDIQFVSEADRDYFRTDRQLKAFKKLKKYLLEAKKYIKIQLEKKKKKSKSEQVDIQTELKELARELRNDLIEKEDYDYAVKMLLKPTADDLEEVKSKFEKIDQTVKKAIKKFGYEEENLDFDEEDEFLLAPEEPFESKKADINKLVDEKNRRFTMEEFNDLYENMESLEEDLNQKQQDKQNDQQALAIGTILKQRQQAKKTGKETPQQSIAAQKNAIAKLSQLKVDPKLIAQLQADGKL